MVMTYEYPLFISIIYEELNCINNLLKYFNMDFTG